MIVLISSVFLVAAQIIGVTDNQASRIVVQGSGSIKTPPNIARLSYDVRGDGLTSDKAVAELVAESAAIEKALRSIDNAIDIHSDSVRVQAVRAKGCEEREYEDTVHLSTGACAITGYVAVQDFDLRTSRVADAGTLVGLAGRHGAYNPKIDAFSLADDQQAKRAAIAKAMVDARAKAEAVAAGTAARLGEIMLVSLDNAREQLGDIIVTGSRALAPASERDEPIQVSVNPSPVESSAQVTVSYAITR
jgi:uncharacterized protein YggE